MRRKFLPYILTLSTVFMLALSILYIPLVLGQDKTEIIDSLEDLHDYVSELPNDAFEHQNNGSIAGKQKALGNKIKAVIHKIESGAYQGAISKLTNDMIGKAEKWLVPPWENELKDLIQDIIDKILGKVPPPTPDFDITTSPDLLTIELDGSDTSTITITSLNNFSEWVDLTVSGVPSNVTATFDPGQVAPPTDGEATSILTVSVGTSATPDVYTLTVTGTSNLLQHSADITLEITELPPPPDFSIEADPNFLTIVEGSSDTSIITITSENGFNQPVDLAVTSPPITGVSTSLDPVQVTPPADGSTESTLTVQVDETATPGMYELTVTGTSGSLQHSEDIELEITAALPSPDFSIGIHPSSLSIQRGTSDTANIVIASLNGFSNLVTLTVSPAIDGVTYSLNPSAVTPPADDTINSTLTIAIAETAVLDDHDLIITGTSGALQHSESLSLEVTAAPAPSDEEPPTVRIDEPADGSYLAGVVNIVVFMYDENFKRAELTINGTVMAFWTSENVPVGEQSISWDTTLQEYPDSPYVIRVSAEDVAGNTNAATRTVTVDNTKPTASIDAPAEGSYLRGFVLIRVTGEDRNLYKMSLKIDSVSVKNWASGGSQIYEWNTKGDPDGSHNIVLTVQDKAGNTEERSLATFVDNTRPVIETPAWEPKEPLSDTQVNVTVEVNDPLPSSGILNVTLWYKNTTMYNYRPITLSLDPSGNWTARIPAHSLETTVKFFIEAFDKAGNEALSDDLYDYNVIAPAGLALAWIIAIIMLILAATAAAIYFWRKRRKRQRIAGQGGSYKLTVLLCF